MNRKTTSFVFVAALLAALPMWASTATVTVQGYMNPWLAGMPNGSVSKGDSAPGQSPVLAITNFVTGTAIHFSTTSTCGFAYSGGCGPYSGGSSADGDTSGGYSYADNGMSGVTAPWNSLVGVFLNDTQPDLGIAPPDLSFIDGFGNLQIGFSSLSPALGQVFFIGDGLTATGSGSVQDFFAPTGATRLFLGSLDGSGWSNNGGYQDVTITYTSTAPTPEPSTFLLATGALIGLAGRLRRFV